MVFSIPPSLVCVFVGVLDREGVVKDDGRERLLTGATWRIGFGGTGSQALGLFDLLRSMLGVPSSGLGSLVGI